MAIAGKRLKHPIKSSSTNQNFTGNLVNKWCIGADDVSSLTQLTLKKLESVDNLVKIPKVNLKGR